MDFIPLFFSVQKNLFLTKKFTNTSKKGEGKCNQCNYESSQAGNLRAHLKTHSGEKSNNCNTCNYASSRRGDLKPTVEKSRGTCSCQDSCRQLPLCREGSTQYRLGGECSSWQSSCLWEDFQKTDLCCVTEIFCVVLLSFSYFYFHLGSNNLIRYSTTLIVYWQDNPWDCWLDNFFSQMVGQ